MDGKELTSQFASAALVVYVIQYLRTVPWIARFITWLPVDNATVHRWLSVLGAAATAIGIHAAFDGNAQTGWHVSFTIPPLVEMLHATWDFAQQLVFQQVTYDAVVKDRQQGEASS